MMRKIRRQEEILGWLPAVDLVDSTLRISVVLEVLFVMNGIINPWVAPMQLIRTDFGRRLGIAGSEKK